MENIIIKFKKFREDAIIPSYAHAGDSGLDLSVVDVVTYDKEIQNLWTKEDIYILKPSEILTFTTGLGIEIPYGYEGQGRSRSGLACNGGIVVINSPGTIDSNYRGEIKVTLINLSDSLWAIEKYDRVAQLVICPVVGAIIYEVQELSDSNRGTNGYGSTGI